MMSSIDLFLSRDCGGGAGPEIEFARAGLAPAPAPVPTPAVVALIAPNPGLLNAEDVPTLDPSLAGPEVAVAVADAEDVVMLEFAKRLWPESVDVFDVSDAAAPVVAAGDGSWLAPGLEDPKAGNRLPLKGVLADAGSADGCDVLAAVSDCGWF